MFWGTRDDTNPIKSAILPITDCQDCHIDTDAINQLAGTNIEILNVDGGSS